MQLHKGQTGIVTLVENGLQNEKIILLGLACFGLSACISGNGFAPFVTHSQGNEDSVQMVRVDGLGLVEQFSIEPGCVGKLDGDYSDCTYGSVRSELVEDVWTAKTYGLGQPSSAWYGWDIYLPSDFPSATTQQNGQNMFGQWHNGQCPHLSVVNQRDTNAVGFQLLRSLGNYECKMTSFFNLTSLTQMRGRWTRFEFFVRWDEQQGEIIAFVNGIQRARYEGRTLVEGLESKNSFRYGLYLCCTDNINLIQPTFVRYANVSRAETREGLLVNAEQ